jgi:hypothetical protein
MGHPDGHPEDSGFETFVALRSLSGQGSILSNLDSDYPVTLQ